MVAAISGTPSQNNPKTPPAATHLHNPSRRPLLPSEKDNGVASLPRKPKAREITSRYLSSWSSSSSSSNSAAAVTTSSRRFPSPLVSRGSSLPEPSVPKRALSVERRRPVTPRPITPQADSRHGNAGAEMSSAAKVLWTSSRSLSVSFQGESFSLPVSKVKAPPPQTPNLSRKATPERRTTPGRVRPDSGGRDHQVENSKPIDQHRWPARARQSNPLTRSMDCTSEKKAPGGRLSCSAVRALQQSMIDEPRRPSFDNRFFSDSSNVQAVKHVQVGHDADSDNGSHAPCDITTSDTESVSSGSNSGVQDLGLAPRGRATPRGISVPARFWQETNSRLRRLQDPGSPLLTTGSRTTAPPSKIISSKKALVDSPSSSPRTVTSNRALSSPLKGPLRHPSPSKLMASSTFSPSRGMPSPSRTRNLSMGSVSNQPTNAPSILSFAVDVRRGKMGENRIEDAHTLRLLYNRHLQWRFVNARADAAMSMQRVTAEKNLYNAWLTTSELRGSVTIKRGQLQLLRQKLKLSTILRGQMSYLEEWSHLDKDHSNSLSEAIEALKASTLRLPVTGGARADIQKVKDAVGSAVDVMQFMGSSICSLSSKLEGMNSLVTELADVAAKERALLDECKNLLSTVSSMQVEECSLRTHLLQLKRTPQLTQP